MAEKTYDSPVKERFEFVLSINGNIICQRYFGINNFQERSLGSVNLSEAVRACMALMDRDLKEKTDIYNYYTAPQVFKDKAEMEWWVKNQPFKLDVPGFAVLRDTEEVFTWNGTEMQPYNKPFNTADYVGNTDEEAPCVLKFAFLDNGEEVRSISWDGNKYPKFVRTNIDISNSKNKFEADGVYAPYEAFIINQFNNCRRDLIPEIKRKLIWACSGENLRYFSRVRYGDKEYDLNLQAYNERLFKDMKRGER